MHDLTNRYEIVERSRKKNIIWNLNELLQNKNHLKPDDSIMKNYFSQTSLRIKQYSSQSLRNISKFQPLKKQGFKINFRSSKTQNDARKKNNRKFDQKNTLTRTFSMQFSKNNNLKEKCMTTFKSHQLYNKLQVHENKKSSIKIQQEDKSLLNQKYKRINNVQNPQIGYKSQNLQSFHREYLRKGSSLQKQIVLNLLRTKMINEHQQKNTAQHNNQDILKMIRIFKGVNHLNKYQSEQNPVKGQEKNKTKIIKEKYCPIQILKKHHALKMFDRWEVPNDEQIYQHKIQVDIQPQYIS